MRIINGKLLTMEDIYFENGFVEFENGKITAFGDMKDLDEVYYGEIFDANGGYILPGLIDSHTHLGIKEESIGFEGDDMNETTDPITPHLRAIDAVYIGDSAFQKAINAGITTVVVSPGSANIVGGQALAIKLAGSSIDDMIVKNPCAMKIALGENPKAVYGASNKAPMTRMVTAAMLREVLIQTKKYMDKKKKDKEGSYNAKLEALIPVLCREIPAHIHAHRSDDILTAIRLTKEFNIKCTIIHTSDGERVAKYLKKEGVMAILGPLILSSPTIETMNAEPKVANELYKEGVIFAITTDHVSTPLEFLAVSAALTVREGLPEMEAFKTITINPAIIAGIENRVGSISIGKDADIVVFNGHPFSYMTKAVAVFIDGKRVDTI